MKGILPVPRKIFTQKPQDQEKATSGYLARVTPEPLRKRSETADARTKDFVSWKERQSQQRRQNLREGLIELHHRDARTTQQMSARSSRRQTRNVFLRDAPEREDERLTNPSVLNTTLLAKHRGLPDPDREARLARKRENVAKTQAMQEERRREKLHTLYVNAGSFITTPVELDRAIDEAFDDQSQFEVDMRPGLNVWNLGLPETVQELLGNRAGNYNKVIDSMDSDSVMMRERMKKITEELTGGKMEDAR